MSLASVLSDENEKALDRFAYAMGLSDIINIQEMQLRAENMAFCGIRVTCIDIGVLHDTINNYEIYNNIIKDLWICGGIGCGHAALYVPIAKLRRRALH